ncbi:MAG: hypothetical protein FJX74_21175, partial [Armatimonadetes bacterium]|nr:hypothetical protein [Armatimonadota bacterium]
MSWSHIRPPLAAIPPPSCGIDAPACWSLAGLCPPARLRDMMPGTCPSRYHPCGGPPVRRDRPQQTSSRAQDALTEGQLDALLDAVNARYPSGKRNLALLLVMADAGLRVSEAVSLKTTDLVVEGGQYTHINIRRGKGGKPGRVALTTRAAAKLGGWLDARAK